LTNEAYLSLSESGDLSVVGSMITKFERKKPEIDLISGFFIVGAPWIRVFAFLWV